MNLSRHVASWPPRYIGFLIRREALEETHGDTTSAILASQASAEAVPPKRVRSAAQDALKAMDGHISVRHPRLDQGMEWYNIPLDPCMLCMLTFGVY
jgi:hypothetical protein